MILYREFYIITGAIMVGDRKREIWPCPYDMRQNFYFKNKSCHLAWRARTAARIFSRTSRGEI